MDRMPERTASSVEKIFSWNTLLAIGIILLSLFCGINNAQASTSIGTPRYVTHADVVASLQKAGASPTMAIAGANLAFNVEDQSGNLNIYNGQCCYGILQMNTGNIKSFGMTTEEYVNASLDTQTELWWKITRSAITTSLMNKFKAAGDTYDGQPNDDAFKLACIQLGSGRCSSGLPSMSCSAIHDNGFNGTNTTNVCQMAAKIRNGSSPIGSSDGAVNGNDLTGATTVNQASDFGGTETHNATGGTSLPVGDFEYCWSCDVIVYTMAVSEGIIENALPKLTTALWPILMIMAMFGIIWKMMEAMLIGTSPIAPAVPLLARFTVIAVIFGLGGVALEQIIFTDILDPTLNAGGSLGITLAHDANKALSLPLSGQLGNTSMTPGNDPDAVPGEFLPLFDVTPQQGATTVTPGNTCLYSSTANVTIKHLLAAETALTSLACTIHHTESTITTLAVIMMNHHPSSAHSKRLDVANLALNVTGMYVATASMLGMVRFGATIMDSLINLTCITAFAPWLIWCWIFKSTRGVLNNYMKRILHSFLSLAISGVTAMVALLCILESLYYGSTMSSQGTLDPNEILGTVTRMVDNFDPTHYDAWAQLMVFCIFTLGGCSLANQIMDHATKITSAVLGVAVSDTLSGALNSSVETVRRAMTASISPLATLAAPKAGRMLGALLRR